MKTVCFTGLTHTLHELLVLVGSNKRLFWLIGQLLDGCLILDRECHEINITSLDVLILDFNLEIFNKMFLWT
jgi:hypothetical protein